MSIFSYSLSAEIFPDKMEIAKVSLIFEFDKNQITDQYLYFYISLKF